MIKLEFLDVVDFGVLILYSKAFFSSQNKILLECKALYVSTLHHFFL